MGAGRECLLLLPPSYANILQVNGQLESPSPADWCGQQRQDNDQGRHDARFVARSHSDRVEVGRNVVFLGYCGEPAMHSTELVESLNQYYSRHEDHEHRKIKNHSYALRSWKRMMWGSEYNAETSDN